MFEDSDLSYAFRPGIVEAMIRHDKGTFKAGQIDTLRESTEVGKMAQAMVEEGYMAVIDDSQHNKYAFTDEIMNELENRDHEEIGKIMRYAKDKWQGILENEMEEYDIEDLKADIPEAVYISETNKGVKKLQDLRNNPLSSDTKSYLSKIGVIRSEEDMEILADDIDIVMMKNYFESL